MVVERRRRLNYVTPLQSPQNSVILLVRLPLSPSLRHDKSPIASPPRHSKLRIAWALLFSSPCEPSSFTFLLKYFAFPFLFSLCFFLLSQSLTSLSFAPQSLQSHSSLSLKPLATHFEATRSLLSVIMHSLYLGLGAIAVGLVNAWQYPYCVSSVLGLEARSMLTFLFVLGSGWVL